MVVTQSLKDWSDAKDDPDLASTPAPAKGGKTKRIYPSRATIMVQDNQFLLNPERDELHIKIYTYLSWMHAKLKG